MSKVRVVLELDDAVIKDGRISVPIIAADGNFQTDFIIWDSVWLSSLPSVKATVESVEEENATGPEFFISLDQLRNIKELSDKFINFVEKLNGGSNGTRVD